MTTTTTRARKATPAKKAADKPLSTQAITAATKKVAKAAQAASAAKLTWKRTAEKDDKGNAPAKAETAAGTYEITGYDKATATWTPTGGKPEVLAKDVSGKTAWSKCVAHHRAGTAAESAA